MMAKLECPSCNADANEDSISMHSGVNHKGEGFIHLAQGASLRIQLYPAEVRTHALRLLECAEAAETDAIVLKLLTEKVGLDRERALYFISSLRNYRDQPYER
jgi:hypothetical protein